MAHSYIMTGHHKGLVRSIVSPIRIKAHGSPAYIETNGIWDTGATGTVVQKSIVQKLSLISTGKRNISGINETKLTDQYLIDLSFKKSNIDLHQVTVAEIEEIRGDPKIEVLIGMDIIGLGDFVISNYNNQTTFSFRIPSQGTIDFGMQKDDFETVTKKKRIGRNSKCPCGSGKNYKNCCEKKTKKR